VNVTCKKGGLKGPPFFLVLWALGARAAFAQVPAPVAEPAPPVAPESLPEAEIKPEDFVYVAATRPDHIGRVLAPVFVNGVGPFAFVMDTGASSSVISPRVVKRLGLVPDARRSKLLRGITGAEVVPTVRVDSLTAGEIEVRGGQLPVVEPRVFAGADGIFGADAFARGCLYVNFSQASVSILDSACPRVGDAWETLKIELRFGGLPVARAKVGNVSVIAIIDTGAERSLGNRALLAAAGLERAVEDPSTHRQVFAATSQAVSGNIIDAPPVKLGGIDVGNLRVVFGDFEVFRMWGADQVPAILLGMDVLGASQALMVDYRRRELRLLPQGSPNSIRVRPRTTPSRLP
jgi:predicted aspartyl protease